MKKLIISETERKDILNHYTEIGPELTKIDSIPIEILRCVSAIEKLEGGIYGDIDPNFIQQIKETLSPLIGNALSMDRSEIGNISMKLTKLLRSKF